MEKLYGYKQQDLLGLAEFLKERGNSTLTEVFNAYAAKSGKAVGTVRNLYYALAKAAVKDGEIRDIYLGGKALEVNGIVPFSKQEERELLKKILIGKKQGLSVRRVIAGLAGGDGKLALRYQNKYRGALKNSPKLIDELVQEVNKEYAGKELIIEKEKPVKKLIPEAQFKKLKEEINNMLDRISQKERKERDILQERLIILERENLGLKRIVFGEGGKNTALNYFSDRKNKKNGNGGAVGGGSLN